MMNYKNKTETSCVYDAFESAGLPVDDSMLNGVITGDILDLLKKYGYTIHLKGETVSPIGGFFVLRDWKKNYGHLEYHVNAEGVQEYDPSSIGMIATLRQA